MPDRPKSAAGRYFTGMTSNLREHRRVGQKVLALAVAILMVCGLGLASPAAADIDQCTPPGIDRAIASPAKLATVNNSHGDTYTTADVEPLTSVDIGALGLRTSGTLTVGTLSGNPPTACIDSTGRFTGLDNELLRAIADKLGLRVNFIGTDFSALLAQVAARRFDVGSASTTVTDARRRTVGFTNGYNFGYFSLVVPAGSVISGFADLTAGQRIGVVQGTTEDTYIVETLHLQPVKFPDYISAYASLKTHQVDAWVVGTMEAQNAVHPGDPAAIVENAFSVGSYVAYAVAKENRALIAALNSGLDAVIADGTWSRLYTDWVPRPLPPGWEPGSKAALTPRLPDFAAIAARHHRTAGEPIAPKSTLAALRDSFFDWDLYEQAIPVLFTTGLPNTLILTVSASIIGLTLGMVLAIAGISRTRWLRWPARVYTDIFRGLPEVVIILLIGLSLGPGRADQQ
jgi:polar amino acid transport system substrate-binding protein